MKDLPVFFHPKDTGQPLGIRHLALQREYTEHTPDLHLNHVVPQIAPAGHMDIMGSLTPHQEADFMRDNGRASTGREASVDFTEAGAATSVLSFLA